MVGSNPWGYSHSWIVYFMENRKIKWMIWGYTHRLGTSKLNCWDAATQSWNMWDRCPFMSKAWQIMTINCPPKISENHWRQCFRPGNWIKPAADFWKHGQLATDYTSLTSPLSIALDFSSFDSPSRLQGTEEAQKIRSRVPSIFRSESNN